MVVKFKNIDEVREFALEFCSSTTIHGVRYFTERRGHWSERSCWIFAVTLALWFCGTSIKDTWQKWQDHPVNMVISETMAAISTIPFPTVTICPEIKAHKQDLDLTTIFSSSTPLANLTALERRRFDAVNQLCLNDFIYGPDHADPSIYRIYQEIAPKLDETIVDCKSSYDPTNCSDWFSSVLTEEGLCFSLNALNSNDIYSDQMAPDMVTANDRPKLGKWSLEYGYKAKITEFIYPFRVFSAGPNAGLTFRLQAAHDDIEYMCRSLVPGFKLYLHTPGDVLKPLDPSYRIPFNEEMLVSVKPKITTTVEALRRYHYEDRQCYFNSERQLRFFRFYSQGNCELECQANFTLSKCGCVRFYMPRAVGTPICNNPKFACVNSFTSEKGNGSGESAELYRRRCNCLPSCTSILYEADVDRAKYEWRDELKRTYKMVDDELESSKTHEKSRLKVHFQRSQVYMFRREEQYTNTDFLAICGGLLGLCLGVSALSIIEMVYYFSLRLFWINQQWTLDKQIVPMQPEINNHKLADVPNGKY